MADENDIKINRELAGIGAKLDFIIEEQECAKIIRKEQYKRAEEGDRRVDSLDVKISTVLEKIEDLDARLKVVEPVAKDINKWKERFTGMRILIVFLAASTGGTIAANFKAIVTKLASLFS